MADYRTITDAEVDPDAPLTSSLGYAWRDNPIAIAEGATGAPRVQDGALDTIVTGAGTTWVMNRIINRNVGGIGTHVFANAQGINGYGLNDTISGSLLQISNASSEQGTPPITLNGTWRCCGLVPSSGSVSGYRTTLWQRIS